MLYWNIGVGLAKEIVFLQNDVFGKGHLIPLRKIVKECHNIVMIDNLYYLLHFRLELSKMSKFFSNIWTSIIEYETPRLVKIHNRKLGLARRIIQLSIVAYVLVYALWLQKGYQEFTRVESSVTVKIKGITKSELGDGTNLDQSE